MTWTIPTPTDLAGRAAGVFEQAFPGADARGPNSVLATIARVTGLSVYDAYLYQARLAQELMPDTAVDWLADHAATWGVPRLAAVPAQLALSFTGGSGALPAGTTLTSAGGQTYTLNAAVTLGGVAAGVATASTAGIIGNLPAGAALALASPVDGLANQAGVVTGTNVAGVDIEALENWRARILLRIRTPAMGGAASDYVTWAQQAAPGAIVAVKPGWVGNGTVGLVVAMPGPAVPSSGQLATIASYVQTMKPVTSQLVTLAASLGVAITIQEQMVSECGVSVCGDDLAREGEQFIWLITLPTERLIDAFCGASECGDALGSFTASTVECPIRQQAPAHTVPVFSYTAGI